MALPELTAQNGYIFRITHRSNVPWILDNGLHCRNSDAKDPNFVNIGLADLIEKRHGQNVDHAPGGTLSDYIPFYFTPLSMMAYNIHTGRNVRKRENSEIAILVTSLHTLETKGVSFVFSDRHASVVGRRFSNDLAHLDRIDWKILQARDFSRDNDDIEKTNRYQAEALIHRHMPLDGLTEIVCCDSEQKALIEKEIGDRKLVLPVRTNAGWYF